MRRLAILLIVFQSVVIAQVSVPKGTSGDIGKFLKWNGSRPVWAIPPAQGGGFLTFSDTNSTLATQYDLSLVSGADSTTWIATDYDVSLKLSKADTLSLSNRVNLKADTSNVLYPYDTLTTLATQYDLTLIGGADSTSWPATDYDVSLKAPLASPTFTGLATFVDSQIAIKTPNGLKTDYVRTQNTAGTVHTLPASSGTLLHAPDTVSTLGTKYDLTLKLNSADTTSLSNRINLKADTVNQTFTGATKFYGTWSIVGADVATPAATKTLRMGTHNYNSTDEFTILTAPVGSGTVGNVLNIGGGTSLGRAANILKFYTGLDTSVTTGTEAARFDQTGRLLINKTSGSDKVDIEGALRSDTIKSDSIYYTSDPVLRYPISFLDIRHYGVVGDGSTDDSLAIEQAIDDAESKQLPLVFRPLINGNKTFLTGGHAVSSRVHLIFQDGASWKQKGGLSTSTSHALLTFNTGSNGSIVENAVLDGNRAAIKTPLVTAATNVHWSGIYVNVPDITLINPEIKNTAGAAIYSISALVSKPRLTIINPYIHNCGTGMLLYGMDDLRITNAMIDSIYNDSVGIYQHVLDIFGGNGFKIDGLTIKRTGGDDYGLSNDISGITIKSAVGEINNLLMSEKISEEKVLCLSLFSSYIRGTNWRLEKIGGTGIELGSMLGLDLTNLEADGGYIVDNTGWYNRGITSSWYGHDYLLNGTTTSSVGYNRGINITNGTITGYDYGINEASGNATYTNLNVIGNTRHGIDIQDWQGNQSFETISNDTVYRNIKLINVNSSFNGWAGLQVKKADNLQIIGGNYSNNGQDATFTAAYRAGIMDTSGGSVRSVMLSGVLATDDQTTTSTAMASMNYSAYGATYSANDTIGFIFTKPWTYFANQRATVGGIPIKILRVHLDSVRAVATSGGSYPTDTTIATGTISSSGRAITGSGTAFTTEITGRYWIKSSTGQYRRVYDVNSNTSLSIEYAFSPDLSAGTAFSIVKLDVDPTQSQQSGVLLTNATSVNVANVKASGNVTTQTSITNAYSPAGTSSLSYPLSSVGGTWQGVFSDVQTPTAAKTFRLGSLSYQNTDEVTMFVGSISSAAGGHSLSVGGGTGLGRAMNLVRFYLGADTSVTTGTEIVRMSTAGVMASLTNIGTPLATMHVKGDSDKTLQRIEFTATQAALGTDEIFMDFRSATGSEGTIAGTAVAGVIAYNTFTGAHYAQKQNESEPMVEGMIVSATGNMMGGKTHLPTITRSTGRNDRAVYGVYAGKIADGITANQLDSLRSLKREHDSLQALFDAGDTTIIVPERPNLRGLTVDYAAGSPLKDLHQVFALGVGFVAVTESGGNIAVGDLIASSPTRGIGEKQADDIIHSYTVAKASEAVDFADVPVHPQLGVKVKRIAVTYK